MLVVSRFTDGSSSQKHKCNWVYGSSLHGGYPSAHLELRSFGKSEPSDSIAQHTTNFQQEKLYIDVFL